LKEFDSAKAPNFYRQEAQEKLNRAQTLLAERRAQARAAKSK
jgi:hypothetical protein